MSCSYVVDQPPEKSDSLVIIVNNDSTVSVDPETLRQSVLEGQKKSSVSVVRVEPPSQNGHGPNESTNEENQEETLHVNLTIEGFYSPQVTNSNTMTTSNPIDSNVLEGDVVDPFSALDSEQLERLSTALQSEQAKQILGEDVNAMLDVLNDDSDNGFTDHIHFDHCYTNLLPKRRIPPQQVQQPPPETAVRGRGKARGVRGTRRDAGGIAGRGRIQPVSQDVGAMHIPQELRPPPNSPASATLVPLNVASTVKANTPAGTPMKVVSGGVAGTSVPVILQGTNASGQAKIYFVKLADGKYRQVVAQRRVITPAASQEGQMVLQQQQSQHILIQGQQNVQLVQLPKGQQIQLVQEQPSVPQEQQQPAQQPSQQPEEQEEAQLQPQYVIVGGEAQRTPGADALLSPTDGEGSSPADGAAVTPKSWTPRTRGVVVRGAPLGRVVRGGRGGVSARGLLTRGGGVKARGGRGVLARGGRVGRLKVPAEVDGLAQEMEAALETMASPKKDDSEAFRPLSPRQEKARAKAARMKSTDEDEGVLSDEHSQKHHPASGKKVPRARHDSTSMDVLKSPPGARKTYAKKSSATSDALPKGQTVLSFPVVQPTPAQEHTSDTAPKTPAPDKTLEKTDALKDAQTPGALARKNYPKRENRKPPAHLADALGPALFSTPDIIRRVDHKIETPKSKNATPLVQSSTATTIAVQSPAVIVQPTDMLGAIECDKNVLPMMVEEMAALPPESAPSISISDMLEMSQGPTDQMEHVVTQPQEKLPAVTVIMNAAPGQPDEQSLLESIHAEVAKSQDDHMPGGLALENMAGMVEAPSDVSVKVGRAAARKAEAHVKERLQEVDSVLESFEAVADEDFEDDVGSEDGSWNSEDDPERLWCICREPHNNRFMICCDGCEEWFHGQCVGITKLMGQRMEEKGQEWSCPNCKKAKEEKKSKGSPKSAKKERRESSLSESEPMKSPAEPSPQKEPKSSVPPKDASHLKTSSKASPLKATKEIPHRKSIEGKALPSPIEPKSPPPPAKEPKTAHVPKDPKTAHVPKDPKTAHVPKDPRTPQVSKEAKASHPPKEAKLAVAPKEAKAHAPAAVTKEVKTHPTAEVKAKTPAKEPKKQAVPKEAKAAAKETAAPVKEPVQTPAKPASKPAAATPSAKQPVKGVTSHALCVGCKKAAARPETVYCSDDCIKEYCEEIIKVLSNDYATPLKPDHRIPVMEKKTGRLLTVPAGENSANLAPWLCSNPTFEILRPSVPSSRGGVAAHPHGPPQRPVRPPAATPPSAKKPKKLTSTASLRAQQAALEQQQILEQSRKDAINAEIPVKQVKPKQVTLGFHIPKVANEGSQGPQGPLGPLGPLGPTAKPQPAAAPAKTPEGSKPGVKGSKPWKLKLKQTQLLFAPSTPVPIKTATPQASKTPSGSETPPSGSPGGPHGGSPAGPLAGPPAGPPGSLGFVLSKNRKGQTTLVQRTPSSDGESSAKKRLLSPDTPTPPDKVKQRTPLVIKAPRKIEKKPSTSEIQPKKSIDAVIPSTAEKETEKEPERDSSKVDPIRATTLKMLKETLMARIKVCNDLTVTGEEIEKIVSCIEEEMFSLFKDTGIKYKAKYRSLIFNIRDLKNETLFRRIADGSITPAQLVRLSAEEMASQELARWRELQAQHQLEMIRKNELDLLQRAKSVVMKTHKGEQEIETEGVTPVPEIDPNTTVTDLVSALNDSVTSTTVEEVEPEQRELTMKEREQERREKEREQKRRDEQDKELASRNRKGSKDRHSRRDKDDKKKSRHRSRKKTDRDKSRERSRSTRDKSHDRDRSHETKDDKDKEKTHHRSRSRSRSRATGRESKRKTSRDHGSSKKRDSKDEETKEESEPQATDSDSQRRVDEPDVSDHEPSSTVNISTPETNAEDLQWSGEEKLTDSVMWRGVVCVPDVARLDTYASPLSGDCSDLIKEFRDTILCCGRIPPKTMWDYILKMRKSCSKDIVVVRFDLNAGTDQKTQFMSFFDYLTSRNRLGVVKIPSTMIKDFYIFPLTSECPIPQAMLPLGLTFEENRPNIMVGVIVLNRRKRSLGSVPAASTLPKVPKLLPSTPSLESEQELTPTQPTSFSVLQKTVSESLSPPLSPSLRSSIPAGTSKLDDEIDDDNEPYSPGAGESDNEDSSKKLDDDLLERTDEEELRLRREELSRKIAEQKQQIQSINSAIGQISPWEDDEENEAYSPSRSITPTTPPPDLNMEPILSRTPGSSRPILVRDPIVQNFGLLEPEPLDTSDLLSDERPLPHPVVDYFTLPLPSTSSNAATETPPTGVPAPVPAPVSVPVTRDPRVDPRTDPRMDPRVESRPTDPRIDPRLVDPRVDRRVEPPPKKSTLSELTDEDLIRKAETQIAEQLATEGIVPRNLTQPPPPGMETEMGYSTATPPPMPYPPPVRPSPFAPDLSLTAGSGYTSNNSASSDLSAPGTSLDRTSRLGRAPRSPPARVGGRQSPSDSAGSRRRRSYSSRHGRDNSSDSSDSDSSVASGSSGKRSSSRWSDGKPPSPSEKKRSRSRELYRDRDKRGRDHSREWEYDHREHRDRSAPYVPGPVTPGAPPGAPLGPVGPLGPTPPGGPMRGVGWGDRGRFRGGFPGRGMFRGRGDFRKGGPGRQWTNRGPHPGTPQYHGDIHDNSQFEGDIRNFEKHRARTMKMRRKEPKDKSWER